MSEVGAISTYEDLGMEELRARNAQAVGGTIALPPPKTTASSGLPSASSLDSLKKKEILPPDIHPQLEKPSLNTVYKIYGIVRTSERQTADESKIFESSIKKDFAETHRLDQEKQAEILKHAKEVKTRDSWSVFQIVAEYFVSASTIVLGVAAIASGVGSAPGALLIASGGLGIANRIMSDTGGWNAVASWFTQSEELQQKIASRIQTGLFFLSLGLGFAGGIWAFKAGALAQTSSDEVKKVIAMAAAFAGFTRLGTAYFDRRAAHLHAKMREIDYSNTSLYHAITQNGSDAGKMVEVNTAICEGFRKISAASQIHFD